jgi:hypothetical protein
MRPTAPYPPARCPRRAPGRPSSSAWPESRGAVRRPCCKVEVINGQRRFFAQALLTSGHRKAAALRSSPVRWLRPLRGGSAYGRSCCADAPRMACPPLRTAWRRWSIFLADKGADFLLAVHDQPHGHRLHAPRRQALAHLAPQKRAQLISDDPVQDARVCCALTRSRSMRLDWPCLR